MEKKVEYKEGSPIFFFSARSPSSSSFFYSCVHCHNFSSRIPTSLLHWKQVVWSFGVVDVYSGCDFLGFIFHGSSFSILSLTVLMMVMRMILYLKSLSCPSFQVRLLNYLCWITRVISLRSVNVGQEMMIRRERERRIGSFTLSPFHPFPSSRNCSSCLNELTCSLVVE